MRDEILDIAKRLQYNLYTVYEARERLLHLFRVNGEICEECGDGDGWYGEDIYPEKGSMTMNCSCTFIWGYGFAKCYDCGKIKDV